MVFHAYPIEWLQFAIATFAIVVHAVGIWDAWLTRMELHRSAFRDDYSLRILAAGGVRSAALRFVQQLGIFWIGVIAIMSAPPPIWEIVGVLSYSLSENSRNFTTLRSVLIGLSAISIAKEIWAMYDRHRSVKAWHAANDKSNERRRARDVAVPE